MKNIIKNYEKIKTIVDKILYIISIPLGTAILWHCESIIGISEVTISRVLLSILLAICITGISREIGEYGLLELLGFGEECWNDEDYEDDDF